MVVERKDFFPKSLGVFSLISEPVYKMLDATVSCHIMTLDLVNVVDSHMKFGFPDLTMIPSNDLSLQGTGHCWCIVLTVISSIQTNQSFYIQMKIDPLSFVTWLRLLHLVQ